jgi:HSP20 family protein
MTDPKLPTETEAKTEPEAKPATTAVPTRERRPLTTLGREIDRLFEEYLPWGPWRPTVGGGVFEAEPYWQGLIKMGPAPIVDVVEKEQAYEITAEVPGMDESNIEVSFGDGNLKIRGEKKEEKAEQKKEYFVSERRFGAFQRSFRVPEGVDTDKIEANFKDGILTVTLPKTIEAREKEKAIPVKRG